MPTQPRFHFRREVILSGRNRATEVTSRPGEQERPVSGEVALHAASVRTVRLKLRTLRRCGARTLLFAPVRGLPRRIAAPLSFAGLPDDNKEQIRYKNESRSYRSKWLQPFVMNPPAPIARMVGLFSHESHAQLRSLVRPLRRRLKRASALAS